MARIALCVLCGIAMSCDPESGPQIEIRCFSGAAPTSDHHLEVEVGAVVACQVDITELDADSSREVVAHPERFGLLLIEPDLEEGRVSGDRQRVVPYDVLEASCAEGTPSDLYGCASICCEEGGDRERMPWASCHGDVLPLAACEEIPEQLVCCHGFETDRDRLSVRVFALPLSRAECLADGGAAAPLAECGCYDNSGVNITATREGREGYPCVSDEEPAECDVAPLRRTPFAGCGVTDCRIDGACLPIGCEPASLDLDYECSRPEVPAPSRQCCGSEVETVVRPASPAALRATHLFTTLSSGSVRVLLASDEGGYFLARTPGPREFVIDIVDPTDPDDAGVDASDDAGVDAEIDAGEDAASDAPMGVPIAVCDVVPEMTGDRATHPTFRGMRSTVPDGETITDYEWTLVTRPTGSGATLPAEGPNRTLAWDLVGTYVAELVVTSSGGGRSEPCRVTFDAVPTDELWIEAFWTLSMDDIDLHLLDEAASFDGPRDCYFATCARGDRPDWGVAATPIDDPTLDNDDIRGFGPENVRIREPADGAYRVFIHDFSNSYPNANTVTVRVYSFGVLELERTIEVVGEGRRVAIANVEWPSGEATIPTETACSDGIDDEGDGLADCRDPDCATEESCEVAESTCDDDFDNDGDGFPDCYDDNCAASGLRCMAETMCGDTNDDDGDLLSDCADPGCVAADRCELVEHTCNNAMDDDGNGQVDCADAACTFACSQPACGTDELRLAYSVPGPLVAAERVGLSIPIDVAEIGEVERVSIRVSVSHPAVREIALGLVAPSGAPVDLSSFHRLGGADYTNTVFRDDALGRIDSTGIAPFTGPHIPETELSSLRGTHANGRWRFEVVDVALGNAATFEGAELVLCVDPP